MKFRVWRTSGTEPPCRDAVPRPDGNAFDIEFGALEPFMLFVASCGPVLVDVKLDGESTVEIYDTWRE